MNDGASVPVKCNDAGRLMDAVIEYASAVRHCAWAFADHGPVSPQHASASRRESAALRVIGGLTYSNVDHVVPVGSLAPDEPDEQWGPGWDGDEESDEDRWDCDEDPEERCPDPRGVADASGPYKGPFQP